MLDLVAPSTKHNKPSITDWISNIDGTSEMVRTSKLQPERDSDFEPNGPTADMEGNSNLITEEMRHWCKIAATSNKYKKAGPPDRLMVPSTTAEEYIARGNSLRQYFKPSHLPIRTNHLQRKRPEKPSNTKKLCERPKQTFGKRDLCSNLVRAEACEEDKEDTGVKLTPLIPIGSETKSSNNWTTGSASMDRHEVI